MKFSGSEAMREMDRIAIEEMGIPGETLMLRAAAGAAAAALEMLSGTAGRTLVLCGSGNNGGDGIGIAALLREAGYPAVCCMVGDREKLSADSRVMLDRLRKAGADLADYEGPGILRENWDLIVDALFGTGLSRPVGGKYAELIGAVNGSGIPVLACDIPSGISADSGAVLGCAVKADVTVTFNLPKTGQLLPPGTEYTGRLIVHDIGIPAEAKDRVIHGGEYVTEKLVRSWLPARRRESHKGDFGKLLLLCGSVGFTGAAALAAKAALRTGAGLVYLGVPEPVYPILAGKLEEPVVFPLPANEAGQFSRKALTEIRRRLPDMDACLIGPGIGLSADTAEVVEGLLEAAECPVLLDADGINALSGHMYRLDRARGPVVLTPHAGEFRRIGGRTGADRISGAREMAVRTGAVIVYKGHRTVTAGPEGAVYVNSTGNSGMATGGSGDVLSGILVCLLGQGMEPERAAAAAVWIHGAAGDRCAARLGERSMLPSDMIEALSEILR